MTDWRVVTGVVALYLAANLVIGILPARRSSATVAGYVAGDRGFGVILMYFVMGASVFSAFAFLGGPGWAYSRGGAAFYILTYGVLGMAPYMALGVWASRVGRKHGYVTQAAMLAHRFESRWVAVCAGAVSIIASVPYIALQMRGAGIVVAQVTGNHVPEWLGAAAAYAVVLTYVWHSGVQGVGWTNVFQGLFMIVIAWSLGLYVPYKLYGGVGQMFAQLEATRPELLTAPGLGPDGAPWSPFAYTSAILVSALGLMMWPHLFMKAFAAKSEATIRRTITLYPTFQVFLVPLFIVGFAGVLYAVPPSNPDAVMPHIILSTGLPAVVVGLFCAGALAAGMSTGDALVHGVGSMAVEDVYRPFARHPLDDVRRRTWIRWTAVAAGVVGYCMALVSGRSLVGLLLMAYGAIVQLVPGVYLAFLWPRATAAGVAAGLVTGVGVAGLLVARPAWRPWGIHEGLVGLLANLVVLVVVSFLTRAPEERHVKQWIATSRGLA
ncbi:MAG TPA: sodium:solute symporter family protein [Gemmatimonadales bacterium]|nr:sodium:solute symporter family protein [Gemmatimonadales bacterium]